MNDFEPANRHEADPGLSEPSGDSEQSFSSGFPSRSRRHPQQQQHSRTTLDLGNAIRF